ncbi:hypothetical protein SNE35_04640 [Paucibacter sp. R3-3]|uniref:DnaA N-terminal domain-containing protein n=1 Tax=Roseateles agri TaxID=3098619 RepID=A0ABU5DBW8_9BURK|nr:hypothetical protein [Paucibacter sp. R3-3]MDY0743777.1 hypothetical protein [Paucibacter sp. R3-3]
MNPLLQAQWQRLFRTEGEGRTRAARLELARPADWDALGALWRGVQADLGLPAPAIAVNGVDGYQLWFSFATPQPLDEIAAFLDALRQRWLAGIAEARFSTSLRPDEEELPPRQTGDEQWFAFVAPDLAPVFAETPWLDLTPNPEGQAELLSRLASIADADFRRAMQDLAPAPTTSAAPAGKATESDPLAFLSRVMNDTAAPLALRIEAAKALLPYTTRRQP